MKGHKDLDVWKGSVSFVSELYKVTGTFPKIEVFGLTSQIRRAAVSIPSNIAEGAGRNHNTEFIQFLFIAMGSLAEVETQLIISRNLDYITQNNLDIFDGKIKLLRAQLSGLISYLRGNK